LQRDAEHLRDTHVAEGLTSGHQIRDDSVALFLEAANVS
jgi:hypothetical protein